MFDDLRELYQELILDHGKHPRNFGPLADANRVAQGDNPICGDRITVYLNVDGDGVVQGAGFDGRGCAISTASASMMTEIVKGKTEAEVKALFESFHDMCTTEGADMSEYEASDPDAVERLQVLSGVRQFPVRVKCATLAWHTMNAAAQSSGAAAAPVSTE